MAIDLLIALRAGGVSLVLDIENGGLPVVRHWGPDLGELSATDALAMRGGTSVLALALCVGGYLLFSMGFYALMGPNVQAVYQMMFM